jgi:hypothetical protein
MNDTTDLERGYRRLVACYPRSFRAENEEEILTVLLATAREDQRRPGLGESMDLLKGAIRMRMGLSRSPRTVLNAVRLMYAGAVAELAVLIIVILTANGVRTAALHRYPHYSAQVLQLVNVNLIADLVAIPLAIALWLWMAWANGKGNDWARLVAVSLFAFDTLTIIIHLAQGGAELAPAAMIASGVVWAIGLAAITLIFWKQSWPYYARQAALQTAQQ